MEGWPVCPGLGGSGRVQLNLWVLARRFALAAVVAVLTGCNGSQPAAPTPAQNPPPAPTTPPAKVVNTPPTIKSITLSPAARAEVDQDVTVTADVEDAETPVDQLKYGWSANVGSFTGDGRVVTWRLPKGTVQTPVDVTMTLVVTENYQDVDDSGKPITRQNIVSMDTPSPLHVNDSMAELTKMGTTFLVDYFGNSSVSPEACLVDFWDGCSGKAAELSDIQNNRNLYIQRVAKADLETINFFDSDKTSAEVWMACSFTATDKSSGVTGTASGDCYLTAVYEQGRWWLCDSNLCRPLSSTSSEPFAKPFFLYCGGRQSVPGHRR
jgi:hypothetical protein